MLLSQTAQWPLQLSMPARELHSPTSPLPVASNLIMKRHKVLPHPRDETASQDRSSLLTINTDITTSSPPAHSSPPTLKHTTKRIGPLPPTPPAHSRQSSSADTNIPYSDIIPNALPAVETPEKFIPSTPPNDKSPPTPDFTPPKALKKPERPTISVRNTTISDRYPSSRAESFRTAREHPFSSDDEDELSTVRPPLPSSRTSDIASARVPVRSKPREVGLGLGLESDTDGGSTPGVNNAKSEFMSFDGEWASAGTDTEVERVWDDNLSRHVTVRKRPDQKLTIKTNGISSPRTRPTKRQTQSSMQDVLEESPLPSSNATKFVRNLSLRDSPRTNGVLSDQSAAQTTASVSTPVESPRTPDVRRFSNTSFRSHPSTVVEAFVVDNQPLRQKTLRHMKKQTGLRSFSEGQAPLRQERGRPERRRASDMRPEKKSMEKSPSERSASEQVKRPKMGENRHQSTVSSLSTTSSAKSRRKIWESGAIPVVVVPDRGSSTRRASKAPSLRSTSSRRSKRSMSVGSTPTSVIRGANSERPGRKRTMSESVASADNSVRTMDYPPMVPVRRSSLSAPTSRNNSRSNSITNSQSGSLTAESLRAHNQQLALAAKLNGLKIPGESEARDKQPTFTSSDHLEGSHGNRPSARVTPFSVFSFDTATVPEISEAMVVQILPHQERPTLVTQNFKPLRRSDEEQSLDRCSTDSSSPEDKPAKAHPHIGTLHTSFQSHEILPSVEQLPGNARNVIGRKPSQSEREEDAMNKPLTPPDALRKMLPFSEPSAGTEPTTPPQPMTLENMDSPLRNPRQAPEPPTHQPPAIKFIPATPAGLEAGQEDSKQLGFVPPIQEEPEPPKRSQSLLRRALGGRRNSESVISKPFSLRRKNTVDEGSQTSRAAANPTPLFPTVSDQPADDSKLHPFWRPAHFWDDLDEGEGYPDDDEELEEREHQAWPMVDNRPQLKRNLSSTLKRTFAILPIKDNYSYGDERYIHSPDRRTVRRSPSGNMRVVRANTNESTGSLRRVEASRRPYTINGSRHKIHTIPGLGLKVEYVGLRGLRRKLSERKRRARSDRLRATISAPKNAFIGVDEVLRNYQQHEPDHDPYEQYDEYEQRPDQEEQQQQQKQQQKRDSAVQTSPPSYAGGVYGSSCSGSGSVSERGGGVLL